MSPLGLKTDWLRGRAFAALPFTPVIFFLFAYVATTVLGNALYEIPSLRSLPSLSGIDLDKLDGPFSLGFWTLLLIPIGAVPIISWAVARAARSLAVSFAQVASDLSLPVYLAITVPLYLYVTYALVEADAFNKLFAGVDGVEAVRNRFAVIAALSTPLRICLMSLLVFLGMYSATKVLRHPRLSWRIIFAANITALSALLLALNMKWPLLLFQISLAMQVLAFSAKRRLRDTFLVLALVSASYFAVSSALLRLGQVGTFDAVNAKSAPPRPDTSLSAQIMFLGLQAINRMAMGVPFYWEEFANQGKRCGSLFDSAFNKNPAACQPSHLIYEKMFRDEFAGRGTQPAAFHIYEFARAGWPGALLTMCLGGAILGLFVALWPATRQNDLVATIFSMGVPTGYMLAQLPVEGVIFYDHGIAYWALMVAVTSAATFFIKSVVSVALPNDPVRPVRLKPGIIAGGRGQDRSARNAAGGRHDI
ncbi:MAG: hypothetical protein PS018_20715 [bacterium]|nr:hypothetical protein [bacterium]